MKNWQINNNNWEKLDVISIFMVCRNIVIKDIVIRVNNPFISNTCLYLFYI